MDNIYFFIIRYPLSVIHYPLFRFDRRNFPADPGAVIVGFEAVNPYCYIHLAFRFELLLLVRYNRQDFVFDDLVETVDDGDFDLKPGQGLFAIVTDFSGDVHHDTAGADGRKPGFIFVVFGDNAFGDRVKFGRAFAKRARERLFLLFLHRRL